jgi:hypothetical protein
MDKWGSALNQVKTEHSNPVLNKGHNRHLLAKTVVEAYRMSVSNLALHPNARL